MENFNIDSLNEEQKKALYVTEGAVLVTAGAGSGKTRLLTHRIVHLMRDKGVYPQEILSITFTNKAAKEMRDRVIEMDPSGQFVWISTFHSMCVRILRDNIDFLDGFNGNFSIYGDSEKEKLIKDILIELSLDEDEYKKQALSSISNFKNAGFDLAEFRICFDAMKNIENICKIIQKYQLALNKNNALDFDDLLLKTRELFGANKNVLLKYANRFRYILVDEFQDTNKVQYDIVKKLASVHGNVFVVGDEDQCIYSWRGANFENIFKFKDDFNDAKIFKLERNYRSTPNILKMANSVISHNKSRLEKKLWTEKSDACDPEIYTSFDEREEALFVAKKIAMLITKGYKFKDMAILLRLNALTRPFEEALLSYNIPYNVYGGFKFFERVEIKNVLSYLRLFTNPLDDISFARVINFPKRGIGDGTLSKIKESKGEKSFVNYLIENGENDQTFKKALEFRERYIELQKDLQDLKIDEFVEKVIKSFGIKNAYNNKSEEDHNKLLNLDGLVASVAEFAEKNPLASLTDYLESVTLVSDLDQMGDSDNVSLATVHAVKGLEFKVVFIVGLEEKIFPISRAFDNPKDLEEERRLMYVAITRAEEILFLTNASKRYMYGNTQYEVPSRFLNELGFEMKIKKDALNQTRQAIFNIFKPEVKKDNVERKNYSIFKVSQTLKHPKYGFGKLNKISDDGLVGDIEFEGFGVKSLMLDIAPLEIVEEK